jgi:hypothetical protein
LGTTPIRRHAALDQACAQAFIGGHDPCGGAIEHPLHRAQHAHRRMALAHHVQGHDGIGPEIAHLQKPRAALRQGEQPPGQACQKLWRGGDDHVGPLEQAGQEAGEPEAREIERTPHHRRVGGQIGPDPDNIDPLHRFALKQAVAIGGHEGAGRKVRG